MATTVRLLTLQGDGSRFLYIPSLLPLALHAPCSRLWQRDVVLRLTGAGSGMQHLFKKVRWYAPYDSISTQNPRQQREGPRINRKNDRQERKHCILLAEQYTHGWLQYKIDKSMVYGPRTKAADCLIYLDLPPVDEHSWSIPLACSLLKILEYLMFQDIFHQPPGCFKIGGFTFQVRQDPGGKCYLQGPRCWCYAALWACLWVNRIEHMLR